MNKVILVRSRAIDPAINKIAETLSKNEYEVILLVWDRQGSLEIENRANYTISKFNLPAPYDSFYIFLFLPIWWIHEFLFLIKNIKNNSDIIHASDLDTLFPAILVKLIKKNKLYYIIYDFYADNLPDGRFSLLRKLIRQIVGSIEKFGMKFSDILFLVDESRFEEIRGARIKKLVYIYNSPPDYPISGHNKKRINKDIIIFYAGVIIKSRGIDYMIEAFKDLDQAKLVLAGPLNDSDLRKKIANQNNVQYIGWLPSYHDIIKHTLEADVLFRFSDPRLPLTKYLSPNKLFEAMMCRKPIIVTDESAMANIVKNEQCGIVVPYGDIDAIKAAILTFSNNPNLRKVMGENGRRAYEEKYNWEIMAHRLISAYKES